MASGVRTWNCAGPGMASASPPRSHRGVDSATEAPSRSCLNSRLPDFGSYWNKQLPKLWNWLEQATPE
eukprot:14948795-Alexandrium_andersonii.AAC.1